VTNHFNSIFAKLNLVKKLFNNWEKYISAVALYSVLIVTNSQSLFLPLFMMMLRINFTVLDSNLYLWLMKGDAIVLSHHCNLLICVTSFFDEYLYCTIYNIVHWRGSTSRKRLYL